MSRTDLSTHVFGLGKDLTVGMMLSASVAMKLVTTSVNFLTSLELSIYIVTLKIVTLKITYTSSIYIYASSIYIIPSSYEKKQKANLEGKPFRRRVKKR